MDHTTGYLRELVDNTRRISKELDDINDNLHLISRSQEAMAEYYKKLSKMFDEANGDDAKTILAYEDKSMNQDPLADYHPKYTRGVDSIDCLNYPALHNADGTLRLKEEE